jgi:hypothetical protein
MHLKSSKPDTQPQIKMSSDENTEIKAVCHCGQLSAAVDVPTKALPVDLWLCSCNTCRKLSGQLNVTFISLPKPSKKLRIQGNATRYATSTGPAGCTRGFCPTCGALIFDDSEDPDRVGLYAGPLTKVEGIAELKGTIYVGDTKDGGVSEWLPNLPAHATEPRDPGKYESLYQPAKHVSGEKLHCQCHCGGVEFWVTRPGPESRIPPFFVNQCFEPRVSKSDPPPPDLKWWIRDNDKKWAALLCLCNSCRQTSGGDIQPWAFVPIQNMFQKDGSPVSFQMGTLKEYRSREGIRRYFCGTCSANVFFVREGDDLIDLSIGIADAESGARAEEWFAWTHIVSYDEFAQNKALAQELEAGMQAWAQRTGKSTTSLE